MITTFLATLNPMLTLFTCIVIGFVLSKLKILPESAGSVMAKLEIWVFCPALSFYTMAYYFTTDNIGEHAINVVIAFLVICIIVLPFAYLFAKIFVRKNVYERNVYRYAMAFSNMGYLGDPVVQSILGDNGLAYYKMYTLPMTLLIYTWGINTLVPNDKKHKKNMFVGLVNAPTISMLIGMVVGITGIGGFVLGAEDNATFFGSTLSVLKNCMGPVAMLIAGFTVAKFPIKPMLTNKKVYLATGVRMIILPVITVAFVYLLTLLAKVAFGLVVHNMVIHLAYFCSGCALGLNTVVFPEAYGGEASTGASMAMISHTLCVVIIPIIYALLCVFFPI